MKASVQNDSLVIELDNKQYNEDIVYKCFYWYTGQYSLTIEFNQGNKCKVIISQRSKAGVMDYEFLIEKIKRDLVDFKLRDIVTKETKIIRELIVAKAFAH